MSGDFEKFNVAVRFRATDGSKKSFREITMKVSPSQEGLREVKDLVIKELNRSWEDEKLTRDNIKLFFVCNDALKEVVVGENDNTGRNPNYFVAVENIIWNKTTKFVALEYFTKVPVDLFRTVAINQLQPSTFTKPDRAGQWTKVSPLYCAGFNSTKGEISDPWFSLKGKADAKVHGVSLRCLNYSETVAGGEFDPFTEPGTDTGVGDRKMTLESAFGNDFVKYRGQLFGILESQYTHESGGVTERDHRYTYDKTVEPNSKRLAVEPNSERLAKRRSTFFRFKLAKNTDLSEHGLAVVYDNSSALHFSLVIDGQVNVQNNEDWESRLKGLFLPAFAWYRYSKQDWRTYNGSRDDMANCLTNEVFQLVEEEEPDLFVWNSMVYLPKVAALFTLHDLKLVAEAEPRALDPANEHYGIYEGVLVLYHLDLGWDVQSSIMGLEAADYSVVDVDQSVRYALWEAVSRALNEPGWERALTELGWDSQRAENALDALFDELSVEQGKETCTDEQHSPSGSDTKAESQNLLTPHFERITKKKKPSPDEQSEDTGEMPMVASPPRGLGLGGPSEEFQRGRV